MSKVAIGSACGLAVGLLVWFFAANGVRPESEPAASVPSGVPASASDPADRASLGGLLPPLGAATTSPDAVRRDATGDFRATIEGVADARDTVRLRPGHVLASVGGRTLGTRDLVPLATDANELVELDRDEYRARLAEAIDALLVVHEASTRQIALTSEQLRLLADVEPRRREANDRARGAGLQRSSYGKAEIAFEVERTRALLLQEALVRAAGGPSPADAARYAGAVAELLADLRRRIPIEMYPIVSAE